MTEAKEPKSGRDDSRALRSMEDSIGRLPACITSDQMNWLPDESILEKICEQLFQLVFFPVEESGPESEAKTLEMQIRGIGDLLESQIDRALRCVGDSLDSEIDSRSRTHARDFISRIADLREMLLSDVDAAFAADPACKHRIEIVLAYPGIRAVAVYRFAHELYRQKVPLLPRMMSELAHSKTGIDIHPGAIIGKRFFIDHGTGVVIGETSQIGDNVQIFQGVTLGAINFERDENGKIIRGLKRHPTIEDNVVIYAGATILGGRTTIGNDSIIGSNVWLTKSVDSGTTVIMERPKLRMRNSGDDEFSGSSHFQI